METAGEFMEAYERETQAVIERFLAHHLSFPECIAALDAVLAALIPKPTGEQIERLRAVMLANNEMVMKEMERRALGGFHNAHSRIENLF